MHRNLPKETHPALIRQPMKATRMKRRTRHVDSMGMSAVAACAAALALGLSMVTPAMADDRRPPTPTSPPALDAVDLDVTRPSIAPLLREGSQIQSVHGTLREHAPSGTWRFTRNPEADAASDAPRYEFIMLPNTHLSEMQHVVRSADDQRVTFQITGEVFIYDGRNYLLVSFPPRVVSEEAVSQRGERDGPEPDEAGDDSDRPRSAAEIMRDLERETGPVGRTPAAPRTERDRERRQGARSDTERLLPENTSIQLRRGRIGRDAGGAWQFIFDADASGQADPPMTLMPCQLLHRIERHARRAGSSAPVLISGRVFTYGGRNYLLPTAFQIPRERSELKP